MCTFELFLLSSYSFREILIFSPRWKKSNRFHELGEDRAREGRGQMRRLYLSVVVMEPTPPQRGDRRGRGREALLSTSIFAEGGERA